MPEASWLWGNFAVRQTDGSEKHSDAQARGDECDDLGVTDGRPRDFGVVRDDNEPRKHAFRKAEQ